MPTKRTRSKKAKETDTYQHIGARVTDYKLRIEAGLNIELKAGGIHQPEPDDPLYTYETTLQIWAEGIVPEERAGEFFNFLIIGDPRIGANERTLAEVQAQDRDGLPKRKRYRGVEHPVYDPPPGITNMFPGGGKRHLQTVLRVPSGLVSNMVTALAAGAAPYLAIHEHKVGRKRWVDTLSLQNSDPREE